MAASRCGERQQGLGLFDDGPLLGGIENNNRLGIVSIGGLVGEANDGARQRKIEPDDISAGSTWQK